MKLRNKKANPKTFPEGLPGPGEWTIANLILGLRQECGALVLFWCEDHQKKILKTPYQKVESFLLQIFRQMGWDWIQSVHLTQDPKTSVPQLQLKIVKSKMGKEPCISLPVSLSHCGPYLMVVVLSSQNWRVGCDLESADASRDVEILAKRFFHQRIFNSIRIKKSLMEKRKHFYEYWSLTESLVKMRQLKLLKALKIGASIHPKLKKQGEFLSKNGTSYFWTITGEPR